MDEFVSPELIMELRRLLEIAGADERTASAGFDVLTLCYGRAELAAAVLAVTAEFVGSEWVSRV